MRIVLRLWRAALQAVCVGPVGGLPCVWNALGMEEQQVHRDLMHDFLEMLGEGYTSCRKLAKFLRRMSTLLGPYTDSLRSESGTLGSFAGLCARKGLCASFHACSF